MNPLLNKSDQDSERKDPVWMVVATTNGEAEAAIIVGRLQSLGILAFMHRESIGAVLGLTIGLGSVDVVVPEEAYPAAFVVLNPNPDTLWIDDGEEEEWWQDDFEEDPDESTP